MRVRPGRSVMRLAAACVVWITLAILAVAGTAAAQEGSRRELARELARLVLDDAVRRAVAEQVGAGMMRAMAATLQERLSRRLLDVEWQMLARIVERFLRETLPPSRPEEIAAEIYTRHFDEAELRELLRFQSSEVGRKSSRLAPVVALEIRRAIDQDIRSSPAVPGMLAELQRAFPVLGPPESP